MTTARAITTALILCGFLPVLGCEPVFSHQALSKVFNGVPTLHSREEVCQAFYEKQKTVLAINDAPVTDQQEKTEGSKHPPYAEKHCDNCHESAGGISNALVKPKDELCFVCHKDLLRGPYSHGPASNGDCLACHEPHESANTALLNKPRNRICDQCHDEKRLAAAMHDKLSARNIACSDCHDPHSGATRYFLK